MAVASQGVREATSEPEPSATRGAVTASAASCLSEERDSKSAEDSTVLLDTAIHDWINKLGSAKYCPGDRAREVARQIWHDLKTATGEDLPNILFDNARESLCEYAEDKLDFETMEALRRSNTARQPRAPKRPISAGDLVDG